MRSTRHPFPRAALAALLACLPLVAPALADPGMPVAVSSASHRPELAPIARGFDRWLSQTLERAGRSVVALPAGADAMGRVAEAGVEHALVPSLTGRDGRLEVRLTLYAPGTGQVLGSRAAEDALGEIATSAAQALSALAPALGIAPESIAGPLVGELASTSRALALTEEGRLFDAFQAVQGRLSPVAMETRERLVERARRPGGDSASERARVLAASGDPVSAWGLVGSRATLEARKQRPDVPVLLAAAEIQLSRENPRADTAEISI
jgi:hypothetical protein